MKKLSVLAVVLMLGLVSGAAFGQVAPNPVYFVTYYSNNVAAAPDATVRVINNGETFGLLWADYYVFDDSQELTQCCSCLITPDGINSESVRNNLTANPLTGKIPTRGVIKILGASIPGAAGVLLSPGLSGFATHVQAASATTYAVTEAPLLAETLSEGEFVLLENLCGFSYLLSGSPCTCTPEDQDF